MADSDGLDLTLGAGAAGFEFVAHVDSMYTGVIGGLGSGTRIQFHGNWLEGKLLWLFPCFYSTALLSQQGNDFFLVLPWKNNITHI